MNDENARQLDPQRSDVSSEPERMGVVDGERRVFFRRLQSSPGGTSPGGVTRRKIFL